mgnify:CR=1 FL=1
MSNLITPQAVLSYEHLFDNFRTGPRRYSLNLEAESDP